MRGDIRKWALGLVAGLAVFVTAGATPLHWSPGGPGADSVAYVIVVGERSAVEPALVSAGGGLDFALGETVYAAHLPASATEALRGKPGVTRVLRDDPLQYADDSRGASYPRTQVWQRAVRAPEVWARNGIDGSGVTIAILDSGVDPEADSAWGGGLIDGPFGESDPVGHGTHVAGIAAGKYGDSDDFRGIAPEAKILPVKLGGKDGAPRVSHLIQAIDWTVANRLKHNIRVMNISATANTSESYLTGMLNAAVERAWFSGIVVVVSAGNNGANGVNAAPGNDPFVITVGAFDDNGTAKFDDDALTTWSSNGQTLDKIAKPDVVAPGRNIYSYAADGRSMFEQAYPGRALGSMYFQLSGTSMSAPMVAGVAALILEEHPGLSPDEVKARIIAAADPIAGSIAGRVDAYDAVFGRKVGNARQDFQVNLLLANAMGRSSKDVLKANATNWDSINWDSITWDSITWSSITWDSITWDAAIAGGVNWNVIWD